MKWLYVPEVTTQTPGEDASSDEATPTPNQLRLFMLPYAWIASVVWDFFSRDKTSSLAENV